MLIFYNNFLHENPIILYDNEKNKGYTLIEKCGTTNLRNLAETKPSRFSVQEIKKHSVTDITVFLRDPIDRFISGLTTQMNMYGFDDKAIMKMMNINHVIPIIDTHTSPQFWFLLKHGLDTTVQFTFKDISSITDVDSSISQLNVNSVKDKDKLKLTKETKNQLAHFFTEDVVLYNQFLNSTTTLETVIDAIKKETKFVDDMSQHTRAINYLL
jgi:hypothetical protein